MASCLVATVSCSAGALAGGFDHTHDMSSASSGEASSYQANKKHNSPKNSWYVGGAAAASWPNSTSTRVGTSSITLEGELTPGGSLFVGRRVTDNLRMEGELLYRNFKYSVKNSTLKFGEIDSKSFGGLANVYYDFMAGQKFRPYVGVGLGYVSLDVEGKSTAPGSSDRIWIKTNDIAYQAGAGASYAVTSDIDVFGGYRYVSIGAHEALAGLRYNF